MAKKKTVKKNQKMAYMEKKAAIASIIANKKAAARTAGRAAVKTAGKNDVLKVDTSKETVAKLVLNIHAPLNIILNGMFHDFKELNTLGVRRLSVGSGPVRYICEKTIEMAQELYNGNVDNILKSGLTYAKANEYFKK